MYIKGNTATPFPFETNEVAANQTQLTALIGFGTWRSDWWIHLSCNLRVALFLFPSLLPFLPGDLSLSCFFPTSVSAPPKPPRDLTANKRWQILNRFLISTQQRWVTQIDRKASLLYRQRWENPINSMTNSAGWYWPPSCLALPTLQRARERFTGKLNWPLATSGRMRNNNNFLKEFQTVMPGVSGRGQRI